MQTSKNTQDLLRIVADHNGIAEYNAENNIYKCTIPNRSVPLSVGGIASLLDSILATDSMYAYRHVNLKEIETKHWTINKEFRDFMLPGRPVWKTEDDGVKIELRSDPSNVVMAERFVSARGFRLDVDIFIEHHPSVLPYAGRVYLLERLGAIVGSPMNPSGALVCDENIPLGRQAIIEWLDALRSKGLYLEGVWFEGLSDKHQEHRDFVIGDECLSLCEYDSQGIPAEQAGVYCAYEHESPSDYIASRICTARSLLVKPSLSFELEYDPNA